MSKYVLAEYGSDDYYVGSVPIPPTKVDSILADLKVSPFHPIEVGDSKELSWEQVIKVAVACMKDVHVNHSYFIERIE